MNPDGYCGSGGPNEVWSFGEEAYEIIRRYMYVREELKPYIMKQMKLAFRDFGALLVMVAVLAGVIVINHFIPSLL